ncbi:CYTH domain-containing protein [Anaerotalea alkaliphila]|uniref:CYTH domain-containing protein n=1 Tax=Anaerotalea alkaliphila TaxID=2662126 RepID=A0A7X5HTN9_9FIRM|nr:CYTH domain-containing protein [Anaerotalea alkaliphila]NDL66485.1 CYTH domain-containing protein [Anaerotalea alkaliphila]
MEIERKYLVRELPPDLGGFPHLDIRQGYISTDPVIRIRQWGELFILTCKGKGFVEREEWELPLTREQYLGLVPKLETPQLEKTRYFLPYKGGRTIELDVFHGPLEGLLLAEVEFEDRPGADAFQPPDWFGPEVSEDPRFQNSRLAVTGSLLDLGLEDRL